MVIITSSNSERNFWFPTARPLLLVNASQSDPLALLKSQVPLSTPKCGVRIHRQHVRNWIFSDFKSNWNSPAAKFFFGLEIDLLLPHKQEIKVSQNVRYCKQNFKFFIAKFFFSPTAFFRPQHSRFSIRIWDSLCSHACGNISFHLELQIER